MAVAIDLCFVSLLLFFSIGRKIYYFLYENNAHMPYIICCAQQIMMLIQLMCACEDGSIIYSVEVSDLENSGHGYHFIRSNTIFFL